MSNSKLLRVAAATAVVALGAAACGGSDTKTTGSGATPSAGSSSGGGGDSKTAAPAFNAGIDTVVNASDKKGGTLNYLMASDFDSLDPARTYYGYSFNFLRSYQRTMLAFKPTTGKEGNTLVGDMAEDRGKFSADGKTVTYKLKAGLKFEDGSPITSKDVKYALERPFAADVINGGPTYFNDLLVGGDKYKGPYKGGDLASIKTPDAQTLTLEMNKPFADVDYLMSLPTTVPVPKAKDTGARYGFKPVASGPYKIQTYAPGKSLVLVRNPNWDPKTDTLRKALPDKIVVTQGLQEDDIDKRIIAGTGDIAIEFAGTQQTQVAQVLRDPKLKANSDNPTATTTRYFAINEKVKPLDNIHCRRAVQYAADKVALNAARGGPVAGASLTGQMSPPTLPGAQKFVAYDSGPGSTGNIAKAKEELAACGMPNGFSTKIATTNSGKGPKTGTAMQQGLAKVGIKTEIVAVDAATYYSGFIGVPANVHKRGLGLMVAGWSPDFPTVYGFYGQIVDGTQIKAAGNTNYAELNDPAVNKAIKDANATTDQAKRDELGNVIDKAVMASADYLPYGNDKLLYLRNPRLSNLYITQAFGEYDLMNIGVK